MSFNTIIAQLEELFIEMDAKVLAETKKWALEREKAIYEFLKSDEAKAMGMRNLLVAGGRTWYKVITKKVF